MTKYRIDFVQTVYERCTVDVEADDQEAAEAKATAIVCEQSQDPEKPAFHWEFDDSAGDVEIVSCEEWPPVNDPDPPETSLAHERTRDMYGEG